MTKLVWIIVQKDSAPHRRPPVASTYRPIISMGLFARTARSRHACFASPFALSAGNRSVVVFLIVVEVIVVIIDSFILSSDQDRLSHWNGENGWFLIPAAERSCSASPVSVSVVRSVLWDTS